MCEKEDSKPTSRMHTAREQIAPPSLWTLDDDAENQQSQNSMKEFSSSGVKNQRSFFLLMIELDHPFGLGGIFGDVNVSRTKDGASHDGFVGDEYNQKWHSMKLGQLLRQKSELERESVLL